MLFTRIKWQIFWNSRDRNCVSFSRSGVTSRPSLHAQVSQGPVATVRAATVRSAVACVSLVNRSVIVRMNSFANICASEWFEKVDDKRLRKTEGLKQLKAA